MVVNQFIRFIKKQLVHLSWFTIFTLLIVHAVGSWLLLLLAGEIELIGLNHYFYYYIVTTSTVGFGDISPSTTMGQFVVALFQIPLGLALFGALLGKLGQSTAKIVRQMMTGEKDFSELESHIIIFGWHERRTGKMIRHILGDNKRQQRTILLCVTQELEHPFIDNALVEFARLKSFTDDQELERVGIKKADRIIVDGENDDQTFTCALKLSGVVDVDCHISAYFNDETKVEMLNQYTSNVECNSSKTAEILVRSMQDPGSSRLQEEMMSTLHGHTQFSTQVPTLTSSILFKDIFFSFKTRHNATLLAVAHDRIGKVMTLNPPADYKVNSNDILHYVSQERITSDEINWQELQSKGSAHDNE